MINTNIISKKMSLIAVLVITSLCAVQMSFGKEYTFTNSTTPFAKSCPKLDVALDFFDGCPSLSIPLDANASGTVNVENKCQLKKISVKPLCEVSSSRRIQRTNRPYQSIFDGSYAGSGIWIIKGKFGNYSLRNSKGQAWPPVK